MLSGVESLLRTIMHTRRLSPSHKLHFWRRKSSRTVVVEKTSLRFFIILAKVVPKGRTLSETRIIPVIVGPSPSPLHQFGSARYYLGRAFKHCVFIDMTVLLFAIAKNLILIIYHAAKKHAAKKQRAPIDQETRSHTKEQENPWGKRGITTRLQRISFYSKCVIFSVEWRPCLSVSVLNCFLKGVSVAFQRA